MTRVTMHLSDGEMEAIEYIRSVKKFNANTSAVIFALSLTKLILEHNNKNNVVTLVNMVNGKFTDIKI